MNTEGKYYCWILDARIEPVRDDSGKQLTDNSGNKLAWGVTVKYAATGEEDLKPLFWAKAGQDPDDILLNWLIRWGYNFK